MIKNHFTHCGIGNFIFLLNAKNEIDDQYYCSFTHRIVDMISDVYKSNSPSQTSPMNIIWGGNVEPVVGPSPVTYNMVARPDVEEELPPSDYIMEIWYVSSKKDFIIIIIIIIYSLKVLNLCVYM